MLHQAAMLIIFFIAAVPKTANASNSGVQALSIFMPSPSSRSKAKPAAARL
jgi:hypothetical protein